MTYTLFGENGSGAFCIEAALAEIGAPYEFHEISLEKDEQHSPDYLALNPSGKLPALKFPGGGVATETSALLFLLSELHPDAGLLPAPGTPGRAQAVRWIAFMASEIYPMVEIADYPERFMADHKGAAVLKLAAKRRIRERMESVEAAVAGPWLLGEVFSAADIYVAMFSRWRECRSEGWRDEHIPKICAIAAALAQRPRLTEIWSKHFPNG